MVLFRYLSIIVIGLVWFTGHSQSSCRNCVATDVQDESDSKQGSPVPYNYIPEPEDESSDAEMEMIDRVFTWCDKDFVSTGHVLGTPIAAYETAFFYDDIFTPKYVQGYTGCILWKLIRDENSGRPVIVGTIGIPERRFLADVMFQKIVNPDLPHLGHALLLNVRDELADRYDGILGIPAVQPEGSKSEKIDGFELEPLVSSSRVFVFGMSSEQMQIEKNERLMKDTMWFEVLIWYGDGISALVKFEKGEHGKMLFDLALDAWKESD